MSTYRASVEVGDGTLTVSRPLTAPERVVDLVDAVAYAARDARPDDRVTVTFAIETADESDTPLADSIVGTSSRPLAGHGADDEDAAEVPLPQPVGAQA